MGRAGIESGRPREGPGGYVSLACPGSSPVGARTVVASGDSFSSWRASSTALSTCRGRIEDGNRGTGGSDEQIDLRAAEEHAFGPSIGKLSHDAPVLPSRAFVQNADAKLGVDHVVNDPPVLFIRDEHLEPVVVR
jgi:hypothetical protein